MEGGLREVVVESPVMNDIAANNLVPKCRIKLGQWSDGRKTCEKITSGPVSELDMLIESDKLSLCPIKEANSKLFFIRLLSQELPL